MHKVQIDLKWIWLIKYLEKLKEIRKNTCNLNECHILIFSVLVLDYGKKKISCLILFVFLYISHLFKKTDENNFYLFLIYLCF